MYSHQRETMYRLEIKELEAEKQLLIKALELICKSHDKGAAEIAERTLEQISGGEAL